MERYGIIQEKNRREIVLLRGSGCKWRRCRFCDYHMDASKDQAANDHLNTAVLSQVTGCYGKLEIINSGSFCDLSAATLESIRAYCIEKNIATLHVECHYRDKEAIAPFRSFLQEAGIALQVKTGVETFDYRFRESYLCKGIPDISAADLARDFDEVCLLFGLPGQSVASMENDLETGLAYFNRVCVNIMEHNTASILPDSRVISAFLQELYPRYQDNPQVDILLHNTDFGVGGAQKEE